MVWTVRPECRCVVYMDCYVQLSDWILRYGAQDPMKHLNLWVSILQLAYSTSVKTNYQAKRLFNLFIHYKHNKSKSIFTSVNGQQRVLGSALDTQHALMHMVGSCTKVCTKPSKLGCSPFSHHSHPNPNANRNLTLTNPNLNSNPNPSYSHVVRKWTSPVSCALWGKSTSS